MLTARNMLDLLDAFMADPQTPEREKKNLWFVLTALRGPDDGSAQTKDTATAPIRGAAFPRQLEKAHINPYHSGPGPAPHFTISGFQIAPPSDFQRPLTSSQHFDAHAINAARALDILPPS